MPRAAALAACAIGIAMILSALRLSRLGRESRGYTRAAGRILASHVDERRGSAEEGGTRWRPIVRYAFGARGRTWESEQVSYGAGGETQDEREARRLVEAYPAGTPVDVWYDPADPRRSVLVRGATRGPAIVATVAGLVLLAVGLFGLARR